MRFGSTRACIFRNRVRIHSTRPANCTQHNTVRALVGVSPPSELKLNLSLSAVMPKLWDGAFWQRSCCRMEVRRRCSFGWMSLYFSFSFFIYFNFFCFLGLVNYEVFQALTIQQSPLSPSLEVGLQNIFSPNTLTLMGPVHNR